MLVLCDKDTKVKDIRIHPGFDNNNIENGNDIAVLILVDSSEVQQLLLPLKGFTPMDKVLALGWGQGSAILQQVSLKTVTREECIKSYSGLGSNIYCAHSERGSTCRGTVASAWFYEWHSLEQS